MEKRSHHHFPRFHLTRKHLTENIGLILTGIASIAAALAWNEARLTRQAQIETMQLDERPYVAARAKIHSAGSQASEIDVFMQVSGRTPALDVALISDPALEHESAESFLAELRRKQEGKRDYRSIPTAVLQIPEAFPGQEFPAPNSTIFTTAEVTVAGIIVYSDIFKKEHYTKFCFHAPTRWLIKDPEDRVGNCPGFVPEVI